MADLSRMGGCGGTLSDVYMNTTNFILAYFASKNVFLVHLFLCSELDELRILHRNASSAGFRVSIDHGEKFHNHERLRAEGLVREGVVLDVDCPGSRSVIQHASSSRAFNYRHTWILIDKDFYNFSKLDDLLYGTAILPDADVIWTSRDKVVDMYRVKIDEPLATLVIAANTSSTQQQMALLWNQLTTPVRRRRNLGNVSLRTATIISQPQHFKGWSDLSDRQIDTFPKLTYPMMMVLAKDLHFRYNLNQVDTYGVDINGSFDGLAGMLQRNEVEIGISSMFMRADRWSVLHFSAETVTLTGAFIFRQPSQSAVANVFLLPFSRGVWMASAACFLLACLFLIVFNLKLQRVNPALKVMTVGESVTFTFGTICQQGYHLIPQLLSIRVTMFVTLVASVFAFTSYSAMIVAILQSPSNAIQSIMDLAKSPMGCGVQETTYKSVYFAESTDPAVQFLYKHKLLPLREKAYMSVVEGVAKMRSSFFAFQVETSAGYDVISKTFAEHEKCALKEIEAFHLPMVSVPIKKHSGYRDLIASRLRWQREVGIMGRFRRIWLAEKPRCESGGSGFVSIGITDCLPAFLVLLYGALMAVTMMLFEILHYKMKSRSKILKKIRSSIENVE